MSTSLIFKNCILALFEVFDENTCCSFGNMRFVVRGELMRGEFCNKNEKTIFKFIINAVFGQN